MTDPAPTVTDLYLDVADDALDLLGHPPVDSIESSSAHPGPLLGRQIVNVVREVQGGYRWPECLTIADVTAEAEQTDDDLYQYEMPSDCLAVQAVTDVATGYALEWQRRGAVIVTSGTGPIRLEYLALNTDMDSWTMPLRLSVAYRLACRICLGLTNNRGLSEALINEYERMERPRAQHQAGKAAASSYTRQRGSWNSYRGIY